MPKSEGLELFINREVKAISAKFLISSMNHLKKEYKAERVKTFVEDVRTVLNECITRQEKEGEAVCYLQVSLVRSKALSHQPFYILEAFKKDFYLSEPIAAKALDLGWLYQGFFDYGMELDSQSRKYIFQVDEIELDYLKLVELDTCARIVWYLVQESQVYLMNLEEFRKLSANRVIQLNVGEYRGPFKKVFETSELSEKLGRWWHGILQD